MFSIRLFVMTILLISFKLYSNEQEKPSVDILFLSAKEVESHPNEGVRYQCSKIDPGHPKSFLFPENFPIDTNITFSILRPLENKTVYKKKFEFSINAEGDFKVSNQDVPNFFCISARGFLPGEKIICRFASKNGFEIEKSFVPNPIKASSTKGNVHVGAELLTLFPAYYQFTFIGFNEDEEINLISVSGKEIIKRAFKVSSENDLALSPDVIDQQRGVGKITFIRKSGEKIQLDLPWGREFIDYAEGNKIYQPT